VETFTGGHSLAQSSERASDLSLRSGSSPNLAQEIELIYSPAIRSILQTPEGNGSDVGQRTVFRLTLCAGLWLASLLFDGAGRTTSIITTPASLRSDPDRLGVGTSDRDQIGIGDRLHRNQQINCAKSTRVPRPPANGLEIRPEAVRGDLKLFCCDLSASRRKPRYRASCASPGTKSESAWCCIRWRQSNRRPRARDLP